MRMNILVIEDDELLADGLSRSFEQGGMTTVHAMNGAAALTFLATTQFDLVVLDLGLPDMDGIEILRSLRRQRLQVPVLVLTARDGVAHRIQALDAGADDYLEKPFDLGELEARIRALLRRAYAEFGEDVQVGALRINPFERRVLAHDELWVLPAREYEVLEVLMLNASQVVNRARILQRLTASNEDIGDNALEVYVHRLRRRLAPLGIQIRTVRGLGYLLEEDTCAPT